MSGDDPELSLLTTLAAALSGSQSVQASLQVPDEHWSPAPRPASSPVSLWGRSPESGGRSLPRSVLSAVLRELRVQWLLRAGRSPVSPSGVYRLAPRALGSGIRAGLRRRLLEGVVVEFRSASAGNRVLEEIADSVGAELTLPSLSLGAGGAVLVKAKTTSGPALVRCGLAGSSNDPAVAAAGLRLLNGLGVAQAPCQLHAGKHGDVSWSFESFLPGGRPSELTAPLVRQIAEMLGDLPRKPSPASVYEDFAFISSIAPKHNRSIEKWLLRLDPHLLAMPGIFMHGDLWTGNVLADASGRLSGVVDWDAWRPDGAPGVDLLHLVATDMRLYSRLSLGEIFLRRPWEASFYKRSSADYWDRLGVAATPELLDTVGAAWWVTQAAGDVRRDASLANDPSWVERNVSNVIRSAV